MKGRDSGMPDEALWDSFFDADSVIRTLFGKEGCRGHVVEFGCGYGTFTFPAAKRATGNVYAFDIESDLIERLRIRAKRAAVSNIISETRNFVTHGTGLKAESQSHAMIYNLLHIENPDVLLREAARVLRPNGRLSIIHWRSDISTPRGPALDIRPTPEQCKTWIEAAGFRAVRIVDLKACCPYHFGMIANS